MSLRHFRISSQGVDSQILVMITTLFKCSFTYLYRDLHRDSFKKLDELNYKDEKNLKQ